MSKAPQELFGWSAAFVDRWVTYLKPAKVTPNDIRNLFIEEWIRHGFGKLRWGTGIDAVKDWLEGRSEPSGTYCGLLARAMNKALTEVGAPEKALLPEIPFPAAGPHGDDGLPLSSSVDSDDLKGGSTGPYQGEIAA